MKTAVCFGIFVYCLILINALPTPENELAKPEIEETKPLSATDDLLEPQESRWGWGGYGWGGRGWGGGWGRPSYGWGRPSFGWGRGGGWGGGFGFGGFGGGWYG